MIFCNHEWRVLDKTILKSKAEIMRETNLIPETAFDTMFTQKVIVILSCEKCGRTRKYVEKTAG